MASSFQRCSADVVRAVSSRDSARPSLASVNISQQCVRTFTPVPISATQEDPNKSRCPPERMRTVEPCHALQMVGTSRESSLS